MIGRMYQVDHIGPNVNARLVESVKYCFTIGGLCPIILINPLPLLIMIKTRIAIYSLLLILLFQWKFLYESWKRIKRDTWISSRPPREILDIPLYAEPNIDPTVPVCLTISPEKSGLIVDLGIEHTQEEIAMINRITDTPIMFEMAMLRLSQAARESGVDIP